MFRRRSLGLIVLVSTAVLLFFCLGLSHANSPKPGDSTSPAKMFDGGGISEISIQFQPDQPDSSLSGEEYFVNYRLGRERYRQEVKEMLAELLNSSDLNDREAVQTKWLELSIKIAQENELENLLKIKGFQDVIANVNKDFVFIVVLTPGLTPYEIFSIQDTVNRVTGVSADKISLEIKK
ncbi:MAG TPA: SpoIIIAH-like family protein [Desulfitobacteriaceae bacterium]|nr:SpoIIIAH-like family protein [Desulfitobacteriaceae bacterium]